MPVSKADVSGSSSMGFVVDDEVVCVSSSESGGDDEALSLAVVGLGQDQGCTEALERELEEIIAE